MIKRLTEDKLYLRSIGFGVLANFSPFCGEERAKETNIFLGKVFDRLAAYEDTNLTPAEITELARAKEEGRLVVLPLEYIQDKPSDFSNDKREELKRILSSDDKDKIECYLRRTQEAAEAEKERKERGQN